MLGNCEKMVLISSTTNEWPQQDQIDEKGSLMASAARVMEKQSQDQNQNPQQPLKCPRCDSSNTKFCYYNNYSLSQPRHFCKACKRYWTRGGTLRNVPVGGGCRKNKRVKRPSGSAIDAPSSIPSSNPSSNPTSSAFHPQIDLSSASNHINPLFYGLPTNPNSELTLPPYPRFNPRVSNVDTVSGFDLHPQLSALGLGFSSGLMAGSENGFNPNKQIQDAVTSNSQLLSTYSNIFGSSASTCSPTMASLLASSLHHQKFNGLKDMREGTTFQGLAPYQDLQIQENGMAMKDVKMEEGQNRLDWNVPTQNQIEPSDPSLYWSGSNIGAWLDPSNIGSSVPSLI